MLTTLDITTKTLEKHMGHLGRVFTKAHWNFDDTFLYATLNWAYNRERYFFSFDTDELPYGSLYRYIHSAGYVSDPSAILVYINKGSSAFFRRFAKPRKTFQFYQVQRNAFFRELFSVLSHEHMHEFQLIDRNYCDNTDLEGKAYYGNTLEQSAFAQQAAIELIQTGSSNTIEYYIALFGEDSKMFKKWYSRVIRFLMNFKQGEVEFLAPID
jgi:hypothetical protein